MSAISGINTSGVQAQQAPKLVSGNAATATSEQNEASGGDKVTISQEGKELASSSKGAESSAVIKSTTKLEAAVQDDKSRISSMKSKLDEEKLEGGSDGDINSINARLSDLNTSLSKDRAKLYI